MAFRKELFATYGFFRTDLGPSPTREIPRPNEDAEFGHRLIAAGERLRYEPSAVVYHPVLDDRLRKEYFLAWWFDYGRALIQEKGRGPHVLGIPRHYLSLPRMIGISLASRALRWMFTLDPQKRFSRKCWTWVMAGQIVETYRLSRERENPRDGATQETRLGSAPRTGHNLEKDEPNPNEVAGRK